MSPAKATPPLTTKTSKTYTARSRIGHSLVRNRSKGKELLHCAMELVKNACDWDANTILIDYTDEMFQIVDDGVGLIGNNKDAIISAGETTATGNSQSGLFGTGRLDIIFSHTDPQFDFSSAPQDDPSFVYFLGLTVEEFERRLTAQQTSDWQAKEKNDQTWPWLEHGFKTGTCLRFSLKKQSREMQAETLAAALSARLPMKFNQTDMVRINGVPLPPQEIIGDYIVDMHHPKLGEVHMEFYRPTKVNTRWHKLRFGGRVVGEVSKEDFYNLLNDSQRLNFPAILHMEGVCGTVTASFMNTYASDDRTRFDKAIKNDPLTNILIMLLKGEAGTIRDRLKIEVQTGKTGQTEQDAWQNVCTGFNTTFKAERRDDDIVCWLPDKRGDGGSRQDSPVILDINGKEFEPGEMIVITGRIRRASADTYSKNAIRFRTIRSGVPKKNISETLGRCELVPDGTFLGRGVVHADVSGATGLSEVDYWIMAERFFKLSVEKTKIHPGGHLEIKAINTDKIALPLEWTLEGPGTLTLAVDGLSASFDAPAGNPSHETEAVIEVRSRINRDEYRSCSIAIVPQNNGSSEEDVIRVGDTYFKRLPMGVTDSSAKYPVQLLPQGNGTVSSPHAIYLHPGAPGYQEELKSGTWESYIIKAITTEYPLFRHFQLNRGTDPDERDFRTLLTDFKEESLRLYATVRQQMANSKR